MTDSDATWAEEVEMRSSDNTFRITWGDGHASVFRSRDLRMECGCASCVDERTGQRILDPATVPESIEIVDLVPVGNYGIRPQWSSGHSTGIFTWDRLRKLDPTAPENRGVSA